MTSLSKSKLFDEMRECRSLTLSLFEAIDYSTFCHQAHPDFSPIGWHLGHIAYTEALWILQKLAGYPPLFPEYHRLFAQDGMVKSDRIHLPQIPDVLNYLEIIRSKVFNYLEVAPLDQQERLWYWLLQHESQHAETIAIVLQLLRLPSSPTLLPRGEGSQASCSLSLGERARVRASTTSTEVKIPSGSFLQGSNALEAQDNERPLHKIDLDDYWIDRYPVTNAHYRTFINANGYQTQKYWSPEGWNWLQQSSITHPLYWTNAPNYDNHPVCGVSYYEAEAYATFIGKRLPTEAEWEKAASWNPNTHEKFDYPWGNDRPTHSHCNFAGFQGQTTPVDRYPKNTSPLGCCDLIGNVWEWTATWFDGYPGFETYPYPGYSSAYYDRAHRVLKGGSWATRSQAMRNSFRNWYHPHVREIFAGFRCVKSQPIVN